MHPAPIWYTRIQDIQKTFPVSQFQVGDIQHAIEDSQRAISKEERIDGNIRGWICLRQQASDKIFLRKRRRTALTV